MDSTSSLAMETSSDLQPAQAKPTLVPSLFGDGTGTKPKMYDISQDSTPSEDGAISEPIPVKDGNTGCKANSVTSSDSEADKSSTSDKPPMIPTVLETFEKNYDLTFFVGMSPTAEFRVCSRSVARASKYFDTFLYGEYCSRKPENGNWVVELRETDYTSFSIILSLIHGSRPKIPNDLGEELYNLIKEIDYFDTYCMFQNHWSRWSSKFSTGLYKMDASSILNSRLFWAAWILGFKDAVRSALLKVLRAVKRDKDGRCYIKDEILVESYPDIQFDLEKHIGQIHQDLIEKMTTEYDQRFSAMLDANRSDKFLCKSKETRSEEFKYICDKALLGSLVWELRKRQQNGVSFFKECNLRHLTIDQCANRLLSFKLRGVEASWKDHTDCNPTASIKTAISNINKEKAILPVILADEHIVYLDNQRKMWGCP